LYTASRHACHPKLSALISLNELFPFVRLPAADGSLNSVSSLHMDLEYKLAQTSTQTIVTLQEINTLPLKDARKNADRCQHSLLIQPFEASQAAAMTHAAVLD
jgi:hypothetical protein